MAKKQDTTKKGCKPMAGRASRRHPDDSVHYASVAKWREKHGREARRRRALEAQEKASERTPREQLKRLDKILGNGIGAKKERTRLWETIQNRKKPDVCPNCGRRHDPPSCISQ